MDRLVIVPASAVADVAYLAELAAADLDEKLGDALSAAVANLMSTAVLEPTPEPAYA